MYIISVFKKKSRFNLIQLNISFCKFETTLFTQEVNQNIISDYFDHNNVAVWCGRGVGSICFIYISSNEN